MLALIDVLPRAFTSDPAVIERAQEIWPLFALMQPANGAVFALDGILIGAGDTRFLMWGMLAASLGVFVPIALLVAGLRLGDRRRLGRARRPDRRPAGDLLLALRRAALGGHRRPPGGGLSARGAGLGPDRSEVLARAERRAAHGTLARMATTAQSAADVCAQAQRASRELATLDTATKDAALEAMAEALEQRTDEILEANARDMEAGEEAGLHAGFSTACS